MRYSYVKKRIIITALLVLCTAALLGACKSEERSESSSEPQEKPAVNEIIDKEHSKAANDEERAEEILSCMNLSQKIGQMIIARCPPSNQEEALERFQFGGYVLYDQDFADYKRNWLSADEVREKLRTYRELPAVAPFLASDEEGGSVSRLTMNPNCFPDGIYRSPQEILNSDGEDALYSETKEKNAALLDFGINLNLSPVTDVVTEPDAFMYERSIGADAETTARIAGGTVEAMHEAGMGSVVKHFPGYGNTGDSHSVVAKDEREFSEFQNTDFLPFEACMERGVDGVMMSHVIVTAIDDSKPVSLSEEAHRIIREDMGYDGLIITDDLWMLANDEFGLEEAPAVLAVRAGNDMMISTTFVEDIAAIKSAVTAGKITEESLDKSVLRILRTKLRLGIIE